MRAAAIGLGVLLAASAAVSQDVERGRPMSEMRGDCDNYQLDLKPEFGRWDNVQARATAGAGASSAPSIGVETVTELALVASDRLQPVIQPGQDRRDPTNFSGVVSVQFPNPGRWRLAASNGAWADLTADGALLKDPWFEMQPRCRSIFKVVIFEVERPGPVWLQINGSRSEQIRVLLTKDRAPFRPL